MNSPRRYCKPLLLTGVFSLIMIAQITLSYQLKAQTVPVSDKQFVANQWNNTNGLPVNTVFKILQDKLGYLWIITEEGLVRFDGMTFKIYNRITLPELSTSGFFDLTEANDGGIWATNAYAVVHAFKNRLTIYNIQDQAPDIKVSSIGEGPDGNLWIGTITGGLFRLQEGVLNPVEEWTGENTGAIKVIHKTSAGMAFGCEKGLFLYQSASGSIEKVAELAGMEIRSLEKHPDGSLWIGTRNNGIFHLHAGNVLSIDTDDGLADDHVNALHATDDGSVWAGMGVGGVQVIDRDHIISLHQKEFNYNEVRDIFLSKDGSLWLAIVGQGIIQMIPGTVRTMKATDGLSMDITLAIYQDKEEVIWTGTAGAGVNRIKDGVITHITEADGLVQGIVLGIYGDGEYLYFGTGDGLHLYNPATGKIEKRFTTADGLASNTTQAIFHDSHGRTWVATRAGGVHKLHNHERIEQLTVPESYRHTDFISIMEDSQGNVWMGTNSAGLIQITPNEEINPYPINLGISSEMVLSIWEDPDGSIWAGTEGGLAVLENNTFRLFNETNGLNFNGLFRMIEDDNGYVWASGNFGIQRIRIADLMALKSDHTSEKQIPVRLFGTSDGMANREANGAISPAGWKMNDGEIWFPTMGGIAMIDPEKIYRTTRNLAVHIETLQYGEQELDPLDTTVVLPPGVYNVEVQYGCFEFQKPNSINYAFRLKNISEDWKDAGNRTTAYFSALNPGTYDFEVKAEQFGVNSEITSFEFTVKPFFYQTLWFKGILLAALFLAGSLVRQFYSKHTLGIKLKEEVSNKTMELKKRNQLLEQALDDIAKQNRLFKKVAWVQSHQLRGPLSKILGLVDIMRQYHRFKEVGKSKEELLDEISTTASELDHIIRELNKNIEEIEKEDSTT